MRFFLIAGVIFWSAASVAAQDNPFATTPAENPFAAAKADRFVGRFESDAVKLTLEKTDSGYSGELFYAATDQTYPVSAQLVDGRIEGQFTAGGKSFAYSFTMNPDGESGVFDTEGFHGTLQSRKTVLTGSSIAGQAGELLDEALAIRNNVTENEADIITAEVALAMAEGGEWDRARSFVETLPEESENREWAIQTVLEVIGTGKAMAGDYAEVAALIEAMPLEGYVRQVTMEKFVKIYIAAGNFEQARDLMNTIPGHHDGRSNIAGNLVASLADAGDISGAKTLLPITLADQIWGESLYKTAMYDIATAELRNGNAEAAMANWNSLIAKFHPEKDMAKILGPALYNDGMIHAFKKLYAEGHYQQILTLNDHYNLKVKKLPKYLLKIAATKLIEGYGAIASAQLATGDRAGAEKTLAKAKSLLKRVQKQMKGFAQRPIAQVQALMGDTDEAVRYIAKTVGILPRMMAFTDLAQAQANAGNPTAAGETMLIAWSNLNDNKNPPTGGGFSFGSLVKNAFAMGSFVRGGSLNVGSMAKLGGSLMRNSQPTAASTYGPEYDAHVQQVASAFNHYAAMVGSFDELPNHGLLINIIPDEELRSPVYLRMALRKIEVGDLDAAQQIASNITSPTVKSSFLVFLATAQANRRTVDEALATAKSEKIPVNKAVMLSRIAGAILKQQNS